MNLLYDILRVRKSIQDIFLGVRLLVSIYFILLGFFLSSTEGRALIFASALYLGVSVLVYFYQPKRAILGYVHDLLLLPALMLMSGVPQSVYASLPYVVMYVNRNFKIALVMLVLSVVISFYHTGDSPESLFPTLILLMTGLISGLAPDLTEVVNKRRTAMLRLKRSYNTLVKDFSRWERDRRLLKIYNLIIEEAIKSKSFEDFMASIKKKFGVKTIHLLPERSLSSYEPYRDFEKGILAVPVVLEEAYAKVIFELEDPFQLKDEELMEALVRSANMLSLFIAGFSEETYAKFRTFKIG
jgi:hypothetical protein